MAKKAVAQRGFYEWDTTDGRGQGSRRFAGSAGVLGRAVIEGLFGVDWKYDEVLVTPRLGQHEGYIYLPQASTDEFLIYHYEPPAGETRLRVRLNTNARADLRLRIPDADANWIPVAATVNGRPATMRRWRRGSAHGVEVQALAGSSHVEITYRRRH